MSKKPTGDDSYLTVSQAVYGFNYSDGKFYPVSVDDDGIVSSLSIPFGAISSENSTAETLGAGIAFVGEAVSILNCGIIFVSIYSDVASATDGLSIQQSIDGVNWEHSDEYTVPAGKGKNYSFNPHAAFLRIVYTNGASPQGEFRLQTICKNNSKPSSHRIQDAIINDDDAELVKSVLTAKANGGGFVNISATSSSNLRVTDAESGLAIAKGDVVGTDFVHKFGNAPDFDTDDGEITIWDGAEDGTSWELMNYVFSTTDDIDSISSSSAADTQEIVIEGLNAAWELTTETVTLNGQNRVALVNNYLRVFRAYNDNAVNLAGHVFIYVNGAITLGVPDTNADIRAIIDPDNQQTEMVVYTVPANTTGYMRSWYIATSGGSKSSNYVFKLKSRNFGKVFRTKHTTAMEALAPIPYHHPYEEPKVFPEKTDIIMTVESIASPAAIENAVSAGFDIVLIDN